MIARASRSESKRHELSSSSRSLPLNDSIQALCHGDVAHSDLAVAKRVAAPEEPNSGPGYRSPSSLRDSDPASPDSTTGSVIRIPTARDLLANGCRSWARTPGHPGGVTHLPGSTCSAVPAVEGKRVARYSCPRRPWPPGWFHAPSTAHRSYARQDD
jgi:hypothetical protein